jgi:hypothetical protein
VYVCNKLLLTSTQSYFTLGPNRSYETKFGCCGQHFNVCSCTLPANALVQTALTDSVNWSMHNHSGTEFSVALYNNFNIGDRFDLQRAVPSQQHHQLHTPFESRTVTSIIHLRSLLGIRTWQFLTWAKWRLRRACTERYQHTSTYRYHTWRALLFGNFSVLDSHWIGGRA